MVAMVENGCYGGTKVAMKDNGCYGGIMFAMVGKCLLW